MNVEERLNQVADRYRNLGFEVVVRPGPDDLPPFAKDFEVEIVARKEDGSALAVAKASPSELEADVNVARYAEITERQPGWRFDVFVLGPDRQTPEEKAEPKEPSEEKISRALDDVERIMRAGFTTQSLVAAWGHLEAAMRVRVRAQGEEAGWGTSPRTMLNELYSAGVISTGDLRQLEAISKVRNAIAHGFETQTAVDENVVQYLVKVARRLLTESRPAKQTA